MPWGTRSGTKLDLNNVEGTEAAAQKAWMRVDMQNKKVMPTTGYAVTISPIDGKVWVPVPQVDGPQNKIYSLDPKTHQYKDYLLPVIRGDFHATCGQHPTRSRRLAK